MQILFTALIIALKITAIHISFWPGMIFSKIREFFANIMDWGFEKKLSKIVQKPLWDCLPCMSGFWTVMLTSSFNIITIEIMFIVCGILVLIDCALPFSNHDPEKI